MTRLSNLIDFRALIIRHYSVNEQRGAINALTKKSSCRVMRYTTGIDGAKRRLFVLRSRSNRVLTSLQQTK